MEPFHEGERWVQERAGEREMALANGGIIAKLVPPGARDFVAERRYCVVASATTDGNLWATFVTAAAGLAEVSASRDRLGLRLAGAMGTGMGGGGRASLEPLASIGTGSPLGLLFIDLATRRRLRVNGRVELRDGDSVRLAVDEAYPNCPKYIQRRELVEARLGTAPIEASAGASLTADIVDWISSADTFFVASAHVDDGEGAARARMDASHRGGHAGFVRIEQDNLRIPDYPGNGMYNTLGNFVTNPRAGLLFVDFAGARTLRLTGDVRLDFDVPDSERETGGTGRYWEFHPRQWIITPLELPLGWSYVDASRWNP